MRTLAREFKFAEDLLVFLSQRKEEASISYVSVSQFKSLELWSIK